MELTWHGHSTWAVTVGETEFLIDPFFDNPLTEMAPSDVSKPDYVLLTHGHADHISHVPEFADSTVVATPELASFVAEEYGVEETIGMNLGGTLQLGDAWVTMHRADHTNGIETDYSVSAGMPAGFLVSDGDPAGEGDRTTFYHAGDTALMSEMQDVIGTYLQPDAAALPIGDHYTMGPQQAAIAVEWLGVDTVFPMHYDTFPAIETDVTDFEGAVAETDADATVAILDGDETVEL